MMWETVREFPGAHASAASARRFCIEGLQSALGNHSGTREVGQTVELVVSELVTNAVNAEAGRISVRLYVDDAQVRIEVEDDAQGTPRLVHATVTDERGRGLYIVDSLAEHWGIRTLGWGKQVWVELRRPLAPAG